MFLVDTNLFVHAALESSPHHAGARDLVESWRRGDESWFATWSIFYEVLRVLTHPAVVRPPRSSGELLRYLEAIRAAPAFSLLAHTRRHEAVLREVIEECPWASGSMLHDVHTAVLMREHGVKEIRTADSDFLKFEFLEVVNPL